MRGIQAISPEILRGQIEAILEDFIVDAIKIGMLHNKDAVKAVSYTHLDVYKRQIIPISDSSRGLAERILASYPEAKILPFGSFSKEVFHESSSLVFIGAMGICVRSIAPFAEDKHTDPAVVCIDVYKRQHLCRR